MTPSLTKKDFYFKNNLFGGVVGFYDIFPRPQQNGFVYIVLVIQIGQNDYWDFFEFIVVAKLFQYFETVYLWQNHIQKNQVEIPRLYFVQTVFPVYRRLNVKMGFLQLFRQNGK